MPGINLCSIAYQMVGRQANLDLSSNDPFPNHAGLSSIIGGLVAKSNLAGGVVLVCYLKSSLNSRYA